MSEFFYGIKTLREMDGSKNPHARSERKSSAIAQSRMIRMGIPRRISTRRKFSTITLSLCDSAGFSGSKIGTGRKSERKFSSPTDAGFVLLIGPPFIRPWSETIGERRGALSFFEPLGRNSGSNFPEILKFPGRNLFSR